jgi:peptidoglycan hydrolase-like protein with peptidoglycan-binding domain
MRTAYLLVVCASILALAGVNAAAQVKKRTSAPAVRTLAADDIEDATKTGAVGPGASGPRVVRAQILLDRAHFSPGQIDGVYGNDFGVAVKGYQQAHDLQPTGTVDAVTWGLLNAASRDLHDHQSG